MNMTSSPDKPEIIQQWQYIGKTNPLLLDDRAFINCKNAGITSLQSYVTWAEIEKKQGEFDFSAYDPLVQKLVEHELKWVPFLIFGPFYATPEWFHESAYSLYAKCLEHGKESGIQSVWNPDFSRFAESFIRAFSDHYIDQKIFESVIIGVSGSWGEALYPSTGGFVGGKHSHTGWWCGDHLAIIDFRSFLEKKYGRIQILNNKWGEDHKSFSAVLFPPVHSGFFRDGLKNIAWFIPDRLKPILIKIKRKLSKYLVPLNYQLKNIIGRSSNTISPGHRRRWLDFSSWYLGAMTSWAELWLKKTNAIFADTPIYLVTGGTGLPMLGADFSAQAKAAAKHSSGIRITNQNDNYGQSFILTRLVATACKKYGSFFSTEEAGVNSSYGVTMRVFDAITSGAKGLYFKSVISTGDSHCSGSKSHPGEATRGAENLKNNTKYFSKSAVGLETAVLYPSSSFNLAQGLLGVFYNDCSKIRKYLDFDLLDENLITDDKLVGYRFLIHLRGGIVEEGVLRKISDWVRRGGVLFLDGSTSLQSVEGMRLDDRLSEAHYQVPVRIGLGYIIVLDRRASDYIDFLCSALANPERQYPWEPIDLVSEGTYSSKLSDGIISYNEGADHILFEKDG